VKSVSECVFLEDMHFQRFRFANSIQILFTQLAWKFTRMVENYTASVPGTTVTKQNIILFNDIRK
jgi:hypothetical protein